MRLRPALIMLGVFIIVIGGLALFVSMYEAPTTDELATLKDRPLFPDVTPAAVRKVEIISPKIGEKPMIIARTGGRKWQMTSPVTALASDRKISRVLQAFVRMKAARGHRTRSFVDYDLDKPKLRVTLTSRTGEVTTVAFGVDVELARAGTEAYMDTYTLDQLGGARKTVTHRYVRVGDKNQVLLVKDDVCPLIDVKAASFREPLLVYAETEGDIAPLILFDLAAATITVRGKDGKTRTIALAGKEGAKWRVKRPVEARADSSKVRDALKRTLELEAKDVDAFVEEDPTDLAKYGLDKPSLAVELGVAKERGSDEVVTHTIHFGASPKGKSDVIYAQSSARKSVLLVSSAVKSALSGNVESFRDKRVIVSGIRHVQSATFAYARGRPKLAVGRRAKDAENWNIIEPVSGRARSSAVAGLISTLTTLKVEPGGFVSEDPGNLAKYGLDKPRIVATLALKGKKAPSAKVLIGRSPKDKPELVYAKNAAEPSIVLVLKSVIDDLSPEVKSLRSDTLLEGYDQWSAYELEIVRGKKRVKLEKEERLSWNFIEPKAKGLKADYAAPSDFLSAVADLSIEAWPADKPKDYGKFGLHKPHASLTLKTKQERLDEFGEKQDDRDEQTKTFAVHFGARTKDGKRCYARLPSETNVYEIKADILDKIDKGYLLFRDKLVLDFKEENVKSLRVEGGRTDYAAQKVPGGSWLLTKPMPVLGSPSDIAALLEAISALSAKELICEGDLDNPRYGLKPKTGRPYRKVAIIVEKELPKKEQNDAKKGDKKDGKPKKPDKLETILVSRTLLVGALVPGNKEGGRYAVVAEDGIVFVMPGDVIKKLDKELLTTRVMNITRAGTSRASVVHRDGSKVEVARINNEWQIVSHKKVAPDKEKIKKFVEEAGWVSLEKYVAYDKKDLAKYGLDKPLLRVTVKPAGKLASVLRIGNEAKGEKVGDDEDKQMKTYYATGGGIPAVFLISEKKVKQLDKHVEDLMKKG